jgi:hypothetical protein
MLRTVCWMRRGVAEYAEPSAIVRLFGIPIDSVGALRVWVHLWLESMCLSAYSWRMQFSRECSIHRKL